jgi:hypothetical protein
VDVLYGSRALLRNQRRTPVRGFFFKERML